MPRQFTPICCDGSGGRGSLEGRDIPETRVRPRLECIREIMIREKTWTRRSRRRVRVKLDIKPAPIPVKRDSVSQSQNSTSRRESNSSSTGSDGFDAAHRKGSSALTAVSEGAELSFAVRPPYRSSVTSIPTPSRRSSWLPSPTDMAALRARRKSSLASPRSQSFASHDGGHEGLPALHRPRRYPRPVPLLCRMVLVHGTENLRSCPSHLMMTQRLSVH